MLRSNRHKPSNAYNHESITSRHSPQDDMSYSRYTVACITCEKAALVRSPLDFSDTFAEAASNREEQDQPHVDVLGFRQCQGDTLLLTICHACENRRSAFYQMGLALHAPNDVYHARLANPYVGVGLIRNWHIIEILQTYRVEAKLGESVSPRPVLKFEFIGGIIRRDNAEVSRFVRFENGVVEVLPEQTVEGFFGPEEEG